MMVTIVMPDRYMPMVIQIFNMINANLSHIFVVVENFLLFNGSKLKSNICTRDNDTFIYAILRSNARQIFFLFMNK